MKKSIALLAAAATIAMSGNALAEGDIAAGKAIFDRTCTNCHATQIGMNKIGPSLWNVIGRPIGSVPDFAYSDKLLSMRGEWKAWDPSSSICISPTRVKLFTASRCSSKGCRITKTVRMLSPISRRSDRHPAHGALPVKARRARAGGASGEGTHRPSSRTHRSPEKRKEGCVLQSKPGRSGIRL